METDRGPPGFQAHTIGAHASSPLRRHPQLFRFRTARNLSRTRFRSRLSGRAARVGKLRRCFQPSHYFSRGNDSLWRMRIKRSGGEPLVVDGNLSDKQLRMFFGIERFRPACRSPRRVIRFNGVGDIPAVWFGHLLFLTSRWRRAISHASRSRDASATSSASGRTIEVHHLLFAWGKQIPTERLVELRKKRANERAPRARMKIAVRSAA